MLSRYEFITIREMTFLDFVFIVFSICFLCLTRPLKNECGFGRDSTASLRGIAMAGIILQHISGKLGTGLSFFIPPGAMFTGLFFFISGYGNMLSINKEKITKVEWLFKKFLKIYIPFFVAYWVCISCLVLLYSDFRISIETVIVNILTVTLPNQISWFPKIILFCFSIHWLAKLASNRELIQNGIIFLTVIIYIIIMKNANYPEFWYNSVICYPIGCIWAKSFLGDKLLNILKNKKVLSMVGVSILFAMIFVFSRKIDALKILNSATFSLVCYYFTYNFRTKTKFLSWIGNNSFEFYLIHLVWIQVFEMVIDINKYFYVLLVFVASFAYVYLYKLVMNKLNINRR